MELVVTFDQPMINNWLVQQATIQTRFRSMQQELAEPYCWASLPQVLRPEQIELNS